MNEIAETTLSKIASILSNGCAPRDQINSISDVIFEAQPPVIRDEPLDSDYVWNDSMVIEAIKDG